MLKRWLPLIVFVLIAGLLSAGVAMRHQDEVLGRDPSTIPSPLIGKPAPVFVLPDLHRPEVQISNVDFAGQPYLLNVWASWCPTCRDEHPVITRLSKSGVLRVIGFNYKDERVEALRWLAQFGDPYPLIVADRDGLAAIDWGVSAAPESFLVGADGVVLYKRTGALTDAIVAQEILPRLRAQKGKP